MPLTRVGRYRLGDVLGIGMFSRVVVGIDDDTGARVAIKVMNKRRLEELNMDQYARREAVVLHRVRHPNVVQFVEAIQSPKKLFLVMQIAPGRELLDIVKEGAVPESDARVYMRQLVDAVACLHEHSYAHRDIKPSNVLVDTQTKKLTLIDLGLAGVIRRYHPMQTRCGSDFYKAPETLLSATYAHASTYDGVKTDAWSVGVLAYILLTGTHPFVDRFGQLMLDNLRCAKLEFPQNMSSSAVSFVSCLLQLAPRKRSSVAAIRSHQWLSPGAAHTHMHPMPNHVPDFTFKRPRASRLGAAAGSSAATASESAARGSRGVQLAKLFTRGREDRRERERQRSYGGEDAHPMQDRKDRERDSSDRRRSRGSSHSSSFLWFRRATYVHDEYGEDCGSAATGASASRSFAPKLSREIPISIRKSIDLNCDFGDEGRERSMSLVGKALQSLTSRVRHSQQQPNGAQQPASEQHKLKHNDNSKDKDKDNASHSDKPPPLHEQYPRKSKARPSTEGVRVARHMSAVFTKARKFAQVKSVNSSP